MFFKYVNCARGEVLSEAGVDVSGSATAVDVGAGCGHLTAAFAPLFRNVACTELAHSQVAWLRLRGCARPGFAALQRCGTVIITSIRLQKLLCVSRLVQSPLRKEKLGSFRHHLQS